MRAINVIPLCNLTQSFTKGERALEKKQFLKKKDQLKETGRNVKHVKYLVFLVQITKSRYTKYILEWLKQAKDQHLKGLRILNKIIKNKGDTQEFNKISKKSSKKTNLAQSLLHSSLQEYSQEKYKTNYRKNFCELDFAPEKEVLAKRKFTAFP